MYLFHRKKIDIYANISLFLSYSEVTLATRSGPYPAQMITAVTRSSPYPDQMVDHHLEIILQLWTSAESRTQEEPQRPIPSEDPVT